MLGENGKWVGGTPLFPRHFYKPTPLHSLDGIRADLEALREEAEGLLERIISLGIAGRDK